MEEHRETGQEEFANAGLLSGSTIGQEKIVALFPMLVGSET